MTVADFLKLKLADRASDGRWQAREYQRALGRKPGEPVALQLTFTSGTRKLTLNGSKPVKAGLLKAFID